MALYVDISGDETGEGKTTLTSFLHSALEKAGVRCDVAKTSGKGKSDRIVVEDIRSLINTDEVQGAAEKGYKS